MASLKEKIGYGLGDMSSSMFWKVFSAYLPFFYSNVFGLSLEATATLMLVARIWDAISDPMMGVLADRTHTRWGKYRPYLLWMSLPFAVAGCLLFTTPSDSEAVKTIWAYSTYLLMMTVYTAINVPYGSMLGVMTADSDEKTMFSSYRMFFAYGGSFIVLAAWEPLVRYFNDLQQLPLTSPDPNSWQWAMIVVSSICLLLFLLTFALTREHLHPTPSQSVMSDFKALLRNRPWWLLLGGVISFNFLNAIRYTVIPYYFSSMVSQEAQLSFFSWDVLFYAGLFFSVGEISNMAGVALAAPLAHHMSKKTTFLLSLIGIIIVSVAFYFVPTTAYWSMLALQVLFCLFTGIISPLLWSMYADISDYAELEFKTSSTGLIFSSSSMAQKFGAAFGASGVAALLAWVGYNTSTGAQQSAEALEGLRQLMSFAPALIALISFAFIALYPLGRKRMAIINSRLAKERSVMEAS